jgi:D-3-phosphoglycerate dehydrogenase
MARVLVCGPIHQAGIDRLALDVEVIVRDVQPVDDVISQVDGILVRTLKMPADLIGRATVLKVIAKHGVGVDNIDIAAATARGIPVAFTPGANTQSVAEHTLTMMLMLAKRIKINELAAREGRFAEARGDFRSIELRGRTLGLVGVGNIGSRLAAICRNAFDMPVLAFDPYVTPSRAATLGVELASLDRVLAESDFVSVHTPLTPETRGLIDARALGLMKPEAFLLNCARGGIVDEAALLDALTSGKLAGAGLDVFADEPVDPDCPLLALPNVVSTPHVAGSTADSLRVMAVQAAEEILAVLRGERPRNIVNPQVYA